MSKSIHIASLFASLKNGGGVEQVQATLSQGLVDAGYRFTHLLMEDKIPRNDYAGAIYSFDMPFIMGFGLSKIMSLFQLAYRVKNYCLTEKVDVLIGQGDFFFMVTGLSRMMGNRTKCIAVVHTSIGVWNIYINQILRFFLTKNDHIVTISQEETNTFIEKYGFNKEETSLIYNAIDLTNITRQSKIYIPDKYNYIFPKNKKILINVARLNYQKNHDLLIKAFAEISDENTHLVIIGEGDERENLKKLINELQLQDRVFLLGNQSNPHQFVSRADCQILSSRFEGFPMVLIEGGSLGIPIIALDCPTGPREFLDPQGKLKNIQGFGLADNGILVEFDDKKSTHLTSAIDFALKMKYINHHVKDYCQKFSITNSIKQWEEIVGHLTCFISQVS